MIFAKFYEKSPFFGKDFKVLGNAFGMVGIYKSVDNAKHHFACCLDDLIDVGKIVITLVHILFIEFGLHKFLGF